MATGQNNKNQISISALLYIAATVLFFAFSWATIWLQSANAANPPDIITYQGKLFESGSAVTTSVAIKFIIYDASGGGTVQYAASGTTAFPKTIAVTPSSGIFSVDLGGSGTNAIDNSIFADNSGLYLEVVIENTTLTPRKQLTAAPFALNSRYLMGYGAATSATATAYIPVSDGNGAFTFSGAPQSSGADGGVIYINPYAADVAANETLFAAAVGGTEKFRIDEDGDVWISGDLALTGTSTMATTTINGSLTVTSTLATGDLVHVRSNGTSRLVVTAGGNVGINSSTPLYALGVVGAGYISGNLNVDGNTFVVNATSNRVGIGTSTPGFALSVVGSSFFTATGTFPGLVIGSGGSGGSIDLNGSVISAWTDIASGDVSAAGVNTFTNINTFSSTTNFSEAVNITGNVTNPTVVGTVTDAVELNGLTGVEVIGDYAYAISRINSSLAAVDIASSTNPTFISSIVDGGSVDMFWPEDIDIMGNYAYIASYGSSALEIVDISNPMNLRHVGSINGLGGPKAVQVEGSYAYVASYTTDKITVVNIADPAHPFIADTLTHVGGTGVLLDGVRDIALQGPYLFAVSEVSDSLEIIDVTNPTDIRHVTSTVLGTDLDGARTIEINGKYAYIGGDGATPALQVVDISDISTPTLASSFTTLTSGIYGMTLTKNYIYAYSGTDIKVLDVSNPEAVTLAKAITGLGPGNNLNGNRTVAIQGNKLYFASYMSDSVDIIDVAGADIAHAEVGTLRVSNLFAEREATFDNSVRIKNSLSVGNRGIYTSGDIVLFSNTTTPYTTNTIRFSQSGQFLSFASPTPAATTDTVFIFDTKNSYSSVTTTYLLSVRNAGSPIFSVSANGDVQSNGTYYGLGANVGVPGLPGDLAERVDVRPDEHVEPGDVMVVDISNADQYTKSVGAHASAVAGVISTRPTITVGNGRTSHTALLALIGRVPVKVSNQNGPIERGDLLVAADEPGHAMKYDPLKDDGDTVVGIIGIALENFDGKKKTGNILSLVKSGWVHNKMQSIAKVEKDLVELANEVGVSVNQGPEVLAVRDNNGFISKMNSDLDMNGYFIRNVAGISGSEHWQIDDQGRFVTTVKTNGKEKSLYALQSEETELVFSGSDALFLGRTKVKFTEEMQELIDPEKPMKVTVTLTQEAKGIFVDGKGPKGFNVRELDNGTSHATFDWVVIAQRKIEEDGAIDDAEEVVEEKVPNNDDFWFIFGDEEPEAAPVEEQAPVVEEIVEVPAAPVVEEIVPVKPEAAPVKEQAPAVEEIIPVEKIVVVPEPVAVPAAPVVQEIIPVVPEVAPAQEQAPIVEEIVVVPEPVAVPAEPVVQEIIPVVPEPAVQEVAPAPVIDPIPEEVLS